MFDTIAKSIDVDISALENKHTLLLNHQQFNPLLGSSVGKRSGAQAQAKVF